MAVTIASSHIVLPVWAFLPLVVLAFVGFMSLLAYIIIAWVLHREDLEERKADGLPPVQRKK